MSQSKKIFPTSGVSQTGQGSPLGEGGNSTGLFNISTYQFGGTTGSYGEVRSPQSVGEIDTGVDLSGTPSTDIDDYYSVDMWTGQSPYGQEIVNGIDMVNNKTMTFIKGYGEQKQQGTNSNRHMETSPMFLDSERGNSKVFFTNGGPGNNYPEETTLEGNSNFFQYTTSGYKWGYGQAQATNCLNTDGQTYLGYTFRAKPKFFDVVKWTGDGTLDRQISHGLQCQPGLMIIKRLGTYTSGLRYDTLFVIDPSANGQLTSLRYVLYPQFEGGINNTTLGNNQIGEWFDSTTGTQNNLGSNNSLSYNTLTFDLKYNMGDGTNAKPPTTTNFTVGHSTNTNPVLCSGYTNENNVEYIAYLWGHDTSSSSMIKVGNFGVSASDQTGGLSVNLGWRPQTILTFPYWRSSGNLGGHNSGDNLLDKKLYWGSDSYDKSSHIKRVWGGSDRNGTSGAITGTHAGSQIADWHLGNGANDTLVVHSQGFKTVPGQGGGAYFAADMSVMYIAIRDSEYTWSNTNSNRGFYLLGNIKREKTIDVTSVTNQQTRKHCDNQVIDTIRANYQQTGSVGSNNNDEPNQVSNAYATFQQPSPFYGYFNDSGIRYFDRTKVGIHPETPVSSDSGKYCIWGMKAYPKFFDLVEWTGDGTTNRQISHNLQSVPAMIVISEVTASDEYPRVWHKDMPNAMGFLNRYGAFEYNSFNNWGNYHDTAHPHKNFGGDINNTATPTSTYFTVSHAEGVSGGYPNNHTPPNYITKRAGNNTGVKYYAYLFADQRTTGNIAVGSYTGNGWSSATTNNLGHERVASYVSPGVVNSYGPSPYDSGVFVDLGWEPQWVLIKAMDGDGGWTIFDTTRGWDWTQGEGYDATFQYNLQGFHSIGSDPIFDRGKYHDHSDVGHPMANGFEVRGIGNGTSATGENGYANGQYNSWNWNRGGIKYLYVAIRRDELSPTEGRQVYAISRAKDSHPIVGDNFSIGSPLSLIGHQAATFGSISSTSIHNDHKVPNLFKPDLVIVNDANIHSSTYNHMRIMTRGWGKYAPSTLDARDNRVQSDLFPYTTFKGTNPFSMSSGFGLTYPQTSQTWNVVNPTNTNYQNSRMYAHMFKRARGFMDIIHYRGGGTTMTKPHALGVAPEMLIFKMARFQVFSNYSTGVGSFGSLNTGWEVYHKDMTPAGSGDWTSMKMMFNRGTGSHTSDNNGFGTYRADDSMTNTNTPNYVGDGSISVGSADDASGSHFSAGLSVSSTDITLGGGKAANNGGSDPYYHQCIMFATLPGVSKVGYYLGTGTSDVNVNCGFSGNARFILIKREDDKGPWIVFESGDAHQASTSYYQSNIRTGASDYFTYLNRTDQPATQDVIDPFANGFTVKANSYTNGATQSLPQNGGCPININGARYIFLAIA